MGDPMHNPRPDFSGSGPVAFSPTETMADQRVARAEARLFAAQGVVSVGIGLDPAGGEALEVGVTDAGVAAHLPTEIEGMRVVVTVIGEVDALKRR